VSVIDVLLLATAGYAALYLAAAVLLYTTRTLSRARRRPSEAAPLASVVPLRPGAPSSHRTGYSDQAGTGAPGNSFHGPAA
jgi:uncharacterized membrane protein YjjB (DUF3815 family)